MSRRALVTGASGALGPVLVRDLVERGTLVRAFCRHPPPAGLFPTGVEVLHGDISSIADVSAAMGGVGQVFHLASRLHVSNPDPALESEYEAVNVGGTRNVIEAAALQSARVVFFSSIVVYGPTHGTPIDETAVARPLGLYAETKRRAEALVLSSGVAGVVLRLAAVYGSRMKGNYRALAEAIERGRFVPVGSGENRRTLIHERDASRAALLAADRADALGEIFNVTDGATHTMSRIIAAMCAALGRAEPRWRIPTSLARFAAGIADVASPALGGRGGYRSLLDKYLESMEVQGTKIYAKLGFRPDFDLEAGWRDALSSFERSR